MHIQHGDVDPSQTFGSFFPFSYEHHSPSEVSEDFR